MKIDDINGQIVNAAMKIHTALGPGLFESVYEEVLHYELTKKGLLCERQVSLPVYYENLKMEVGLRADLLVEKIVIAALKSVEMVIPVHKKKLLSYLRLSNLQIGLLFNFNDALLKNGITRLFNNYAK